MINKTTLSYTDDGHPLEAFIAYPSKQKRPLVILCHAWNGRDPFICEKAELIASWGYVGVAIDMYGKGILGKSKEENAELKKPFLEDRLFLQKRLLKGYEAACSLPYVDSSRIAVLGFGFGAVCALDLARSGAHLTGAISVYGHFDPPLNVPVQPIKAKVLLLHGYNDPISPMRDLIAFQQQLDHDKVDWQTHIYGNTLHAFVNPKVNDPAAGALYNPASADRTWIEIENFLRECFRSSIR